MAKEEKLSRNQASNAAYETLIERPEVEGEVQAQNRSEHAGGGADGDSGKVNPETAPATVPADRVGEPAFRTVDDAQPVGEDGEAVKPKKRAAKKTAKKS